MKPLHIVVLDRDTLVNRPFDFDFPHTLSSYGTTEAHETLERIRGADIVITNKVVISAQAFAENPQLKLVAVTATGVNNVDVELPNKMARQCAISALTAMNPWRNTRL